MAYRAEVRSEPPRSIGMRAGNLSLNRVNRLINKTSALLGEI